MKILASLFISLAFIAAAPLDDDKVDIAGRIVDADGQSVSDASAATYWNVEGEAPTAWEPMQADETGAFAGRIDAWRYPVGVTAYSADGSLAGYALVEEDGLQDVEIVMKPSVRVEFEVSCEELGKTPEWVNASFSIDEARLGDADTRNGKLTVTLPQGDVSWDVYDSWFSSVEGTRTLDGSATAVDLGVLDLPAAFLAKHVGKELPEWSVSASRGVPLDQSGLKAHRGKWLLIEFWGYW